MTVACTHAKVRNLTEDSRSDDHVQVGGGEGLVYQVAEPARRATPVNVGVDFAFATPVAGRGSVVAVAAAAFVTAAAVDSRRREKPTIVATPDATENVAAVAVAAASVAVVAAIGARAANLAAVEWH